MQRLSSHIRALIEAKDHGMIQTSDDNLHRPWTESVGVRSELCRLMSVHLTAWRTRLYLSFSVFFRASDNLLNVPSTEFFCVLIALEVCSRATSESMWSWRRAHIGVPLDLHRGLSPRKPRVS